MSRLGIPVQGSDQMAHAKTYDRVEWAEKKQTEIEDELDLTDESRKRSAGVFNILGTIVKGESLQILYNSNFSGAEAWRKLAKRFSPTTPMRGMQLLLATLSPGRVKKMEEISGAINKWETKVLALQRDFKENLSEKMKPAILVSMLPKELQDNLVQQADKMTDYKTTKDRIISIVEAKMAMRDPDMMDCDQITKKRELQLQPQPRSS